MRFTSPFAAALLAVISAPTVLGQVIVFDGEHNATSIYGTWSTGNKGVITGPGFASPANASFVYPKTTGVSYSFTKDGFYEVARYRFTSNSTLPNCIVGVLGWHHGTYTLESNGSISLVPFGDGYQQIQDSCASSGISNFIENYNQSETLGSWRIYEDATDGFKLHVFGPDGFPVAPMFSVNKENPIMLPTESLRDVAKPLTMKNGVYSRELHEESSAAGTTVVGVAAAAFGMGLLSLLL